MKRPSQMERQGWRLLSRPQRFDETGTTIYVYAYVDPSDRIVYIGRTWDPATRNGAHRQKSHWWGADLVFSVIAEVIGWEAAKVSEAQAIREFAPLFNIKHNRRAA